MSNRWKAVIVVVLLAAAGLFLVQQLGNQGEVDQDIEDLKQSLLEAPVVQDEELSEEQVEKFMERYELSKKQVIDFNFDTLDGVNMIGFVKQSVGDLEGAIKAYEYGNIIRPKNSLTFSNLAALYHFDLKNFEKAEKNYLISIANDPDDLPTIRNLYVLYFNDLKDNKKSESLLLRTIEDNPGLADAYSLAGSFYRDIGEVEKAIEMFERHLEINPDNSAVRQAVAELREKQNQN